MKLLHVPFGFHPDPVGGTEVYVEQLAQLQCARGWEAVIAAPEAGAAGRAYEHEGLRVLRFPVSPTVDDLRDLYGMRCGVAASAFDELLGTEQPDVVHFHALTRGVSPDMAMAARRRGIPVVFTYHTPAASCQRGSLLEDGLRVCDGKATASRCAACTLGSLGAPRWAGPLLSRTPRAVGGLLGGAGLSGGVWTALRVPELMGHRIGAFVEMTRAADVVVAVCEWVRDLLLANGVPEDKIRLSRQGVSNRGWRPDPTRDARGEGDPLRLAYIGRIDPIKGVELPLRALAADPGLAVRLDVYGVVQPGAGAEYDARLRAIAGGDPRVRFFGAVPAAEMAERLASYDALVVPSQALETGPLVVLEAFASGVPVVGSRLGGIEELVRDGVDGILVEPGSPEHWGEALRRLATEEGLAARLRAGVSPPRTMARVAEDMESVYAEVVAPLRDLSTCRS